MGKGGKDNSPTQTNSTVTNTNVPEYARPYVENMLGATQQQLFKMDGSNITGFQPYKAYGGTYDEQGNQTAYDPSKAVAGFSPMQQQAMAMASGPEGFAQNVGGYMSPYMQNVTDIQKREAARQSGIQGIQQQAQATQAGAFGGSRDAIQRAERERNLSQQMGDIQAQGSQAAFANAQNQFNTNLGQMTTAGALQQQNQQQAINQSMQDYANAQQYPLMQLGTMSNMLRGLPMQAQTTQQYQAQANPITQGIGALGAGASLYNATKAEGGVIKSMASGGITSVPRYDVGGSVVSQLATMPDEALKKEAMESPSPRIREMAAAILKQRQAGLQAEPQTAAAPQGVGPMGVDYNANYAGGGIIAFARGKEVPPALTPEEQQLITDRVRGTAPPVPPGPITSTGQDTGARLAGIAAAPPAAQAPSAAPPSAPPAAPPAASAGILATPPVETDPGRAAIADAKKMMEPFAAIANKTSRQLYEEDLADRKALGLDNSEAKQKLMQQQMAERANLADEAYRTNQFRRAQFFAEMASTPGNTLVAGLVALKNQIPNILQDAKDQKLARQQADKAIFDLEESMRLDKLGVYDKSDARKQAAIKTMADLQASLTTASVQQGSAEKQLKGTEITSAATVAARAASDAAGIRQSEIAERSAKYVADKKATTELAQTRELTASRAAANATAAEQKLFNSWNAASDNLRLTYKGVEDLRQGKDYQGALETITLVNGMSNDANGQRDPAKWATIPPYLKEKNTAALATVKRLDGNIQDSVDNAKKLADIAFNRLNIPGGAGTGQSFPAPPAEAIGVLKNGNTPQARAQFDQIFGPGAAAKALGR